MRLLPTAAAEPEGLLRAGLHERQEERILLAVFEEHQFAEVRMHGLRYSVTFRTLARPPGR